MKIVLACCLLVVVCALARADVVGSSETDSLTAFGGTSAKYQCDGWFTPTAHGQACIDLCEQQDTAHESECLIGPPGDDCAAEAHWCADRCVDGCVWP